MQDRPTRAVRSATHPTDIVNKVPRPDFFSEALYRARTADAVVVRPARRTLAEMAPGYVRQPVLRLVPTAPPAANEKCIFCERYSCNGNCGGFAPVPSGAALKVAA